MAICGPIGKAQKNRLRASPILSCLFITPLTGEPRRLKKNMRIFLIGTANKPRSAYRHGECTMLRLKAQS
jgi:hypothetical protein